MTDPATYDASAWPGEGPFVLSERVPSRCRLRSFACPLADKGDRCYWCAPEEYADLRTLEPLIRDGAVRCLLLALPEPDCGLTAGILRSWARRLRETLPELPVRLLRDGAPHRCGDSPACRGCALDEVREFNATIGALDLNDRNFRSALETRLPNLPPQTRDIFHAWCVQSEPGRSGRAITQTALAKQMRCSDRTVRRALADVRTAVPELYARAEAQRGMRAKVTRAYDVRP